MFPPGAAFCRIDLSSNNNLSKWETAFDAKKVIAGSNSADGSLEVLRAVVNEDDFYQLVASESSLRFGSQIGGVWHDLWSTVTKSDCLNISRTYISGDSYAEAKDLSIPPGIYGINPSFKNIPENTYGFLEIIADSQNNWRLIKFIPTNIKSFYLMFYNGYDKIWSDWIRFTSTTS